MDIGDAMTATGTPTDDTLCVICLVAEITTKLLPCGHAYYCEPCAAQIISAAVSITCPLCRGDVTGYRAAQEMEIVAARPAYQLAHDLVRAARRSGGGISISMSPFGLTNMPWWIPPGKVEGVFHGRTRLKDGRIGLLVDTGAHDNLSGDGFMRELAQQAADFGYVSKQVPLQQPRSVQGVGNGFQSCNYRCEVPCAMVDIDGVPHLGKFRAPCVQDSGLPGLLGDASLTRNRALIECWTGRLAFVGPSGANIDFGPGTRLFQMQKVDIGCCPFLTSIC